MPIPEFRAYNELVYSLQNRYSSIRRSTLVVSTIGATLAKVEGQIEFDKGIVLDVWELLDIEIGRIRKYSYEVYRDQEKLYWYDPFEHPHIPELASTHPHHKHVQPDIKHNRVAAPGISFEQANLPFLIEEIEREFLGTR